MESMTDLFGNSAMSAQAKEMRGDRPAPVKVTAEGGGANLPVLRTMKQIAAGGTLIVLPEDVTPGSCCSGACCPTILPR